MKNKPQKNQKEHEINEMKTMDFVKVLLMLTGLVLVAMMVTSIIELW